MQAEWSNGLCVIDSATEQAVERLLVGLVESIDQDREMREARVDCCTVLCHRIGTALESWWKSVEPGAQRVCSSAGKED